jgi:hypothetical protein
MSPRTLEIKGKINHLVNYEGKKGGKKFGVLSGQEKTKKDIPYRQVLTCHFHNNRFCEPVWVGEKKERPSQLAKELI